MKGLILLLSILLVLPCLVLSDNNDVSVNDHGKIVGCYWGAWSFYRDYASFDVTDIDPTQCTHIYYGFAELHPKTHEIYAWDPWYDLKEGLDADLNKTCGNPSIPGCKFDSYRRFNALKADYPHFKAMLSLGGWNAGSKDYSDMAKDPEQRKTFVKSLVPFLKRFNFDGLDLDWEYPGARDGDKFLDREDFTILVQEMGQELKSNGLLFTAALSPDSEVAEVGYDLEAIHPHFDFLNIMSYDYHGWWENNSHPFTGHNSPLAGRSDEKIADHPGFEFNVHDTMSYYLSKVPKEKIVMGMPLYGRGFVLNDVNENGLFCPATQGLPAGHYTNLTGYWGYYDLLYYFDNPNESDLNQSLIGDSWTVVFDECYKAPYAYNDYIWVGYDDPNSLKYKTQYANYLNLAGVMVWSIDTDDYKATYSNEKFPMLKSINRALKSGAIYNPEITLGKCKSAPACQFPIPTTLYPNTTPSPTTKKPSGGSGLCDHDGQNLPYPGNCHKYLQCVLDNDTGDYSFLVRYCGDDIFDPFSGSCVDSGLSGAQKICEDN